MKVSVVWDYSNILKNADICCIQVEIFDKNVEVEHIKGILIVNLIFYGYVLLKEARETAGNLLNWFFTK